MEENTKVDVKANYIYRDVDNVKILIDGKVYNSGKTPDQFSDCIFECLHEPRGWFLQLGFEIDEG